MNKPPVISELNGILHVTFFEKDVIDIHFPKGLFKGRKEVFLHFPRLKDGGYLLNDPSNNESGIQDAEIIHLDMPAVRDVASMTLTNRKLREIHITADDDIAVDMSNFSKVCNPLQTSEKRMPVIDFFSLRKATLKDKNHFYKQVYLTEKGGRKGNRFSVMFSISHRRTAFLRKDFETASSYSRFCHCPFYRPFLYCTKNIHGVSNETFMMFPDEILIEYFTDIYNDKVPGALD